MTQAAAPKPAWKFRIGLFLILITVGAGVVLLNRDNDKIKWIWEERLKSRTEPRPERKPIFELVRDKNDTIRLVEGDLSNLGIGTFTIESNPPPNKLRLPGTLSFDPNRFIRVHSRFPGEVRRVGKMPGTNRPLQFGDSVSVGQLLVTIWSKDIGEKKSELVDALSKQHFDEIIFRRLTKVKESVVTERAINDAERNYQADVVAVAKAERTLRSWNFTEADIKAVHQEAQDLLNGTASIADDGHWAEMDVVAAQAGIIVDKNFNVGDIVDTNQDLLRIADLDRLQVLANVFEEDVAGLRALTPDRRKWELQISSGMGPITVRGTFDQIGMIVDPDMHTSVVMGYVDNPQKNLAIGQFITATIEIPGDETQVVIPVTSVIEEGSSSAVFVVTDADRKEYTRKRIAVKRRGRNWIHASRQLDQNQIDRGLHPLNTGDQLLTKSVVELDAELNDLVSSAPKNK